MPVSRSLARATASLAILAAPVAGQSLLPPPNPVPPTNPQASILQFVGTTEVEVAYSRPGRKGRQVFGALVPWDKVWRTGADNATKIRFSTPVTIEGAPVAAGTYELFTIPGRESWTVILQESRQQWGSYSYDPANDVVRVAVKPTHAVEPVETFTITFGDLAPDAATMTIAWDDVAVPVRIGVDVVAQVVPRIEAAMQGDGPKPYFRAAMFYFENDLDIDQAAEWITAAVAENPRHIGMLHRQALILAKQGNIAGALEAARRSMAGAVGAGAELEAEYTRLNQALIDRLTGEGPE